MTLSATVVSKGKQINMRSQHRLASGMIWGGLLAGILLQPHPLLAHSEHTQETVKDQPAEKPVNTAPPATAPNKGPEAEATVPEHQDQPSHDASATSEDPDAEQAPASESKQADGPTTASSIDQQNFRPLIGPGEIIFSLLVAGPFLLSALQQQLRK